MKQISDFARFVVCLPRWRGFILPVMLMLTLPLLVNGCSNKDGASSGTPSTQTNPATASPAVTNSTATSGAAAPAVAAKEPDLQALNRALIGYIVQNHRRPKTFEEFAATAKIKIPPPPPGKKYALNARGFIVLVDGTTH